MLGLACAGLPTAATTALVVGYVSNITAGTLREWIVGGLTVTLDSGPLSGRALPDEGR